MATLTVPSSVPSPAEDCEQLRKAFTGWGTNEKLIISILAHRNASQRRLIRQKYVEIYGEELLKSLDKELSGDFERAVFLWTLDPPERDAVLANESIRKLHASNITIIEIAVSRTSHELFLTRQAYHARFKRSLEEDVASHATGDFRKLLIPLVSAYRYEGTEVNIRLAKSEAHILHEKFAAKEFSHEEVIRILSTRSKAQLNATFNSYMDDFGHGINKDLSPDSDDAFLTALRTVIKCICCPETHFEEALRRAINKVGTDEGDLTRIITTRAEVDLHSIKEAYYKRNSVPLDRAIVKETSGDYEDFLLALLGHST